LWTFIHNMKTGCGLEVRVVKGRRYLYFWIYREMAGRSNRSWKYLGPSGDAETRRKALMELRNAYDAARSEMERRLRVVGVKLMTLR